MKTKLISVLLVLILLNTTLINAQQLITLTTSSNNISGMRAVIDNPALNNNPDAIILVDPNPAHSHPIAVWYIFNKWHVFNLDQANMTAGVQFQIKFWTQPDASRFVHTVTPPTINGNRSYINSNTSDNNPNANISAFQSMSNTRGGYWNANQVMTAYDDTQKKWYLINENGQPLLAGNAYNIVVSNKGEGLQKPDIEKNQPQTMPVTQPISSPITEISTPEPLKFKPVLGKKIILYPGTTGDVGLGVQGNLLQIYSDNPNADVAIGYDQAGTFNEKFRVKANGALAVNGNTGQTGQVLTSNGPGNAPTWKLNEAGMMQTFFKSGHVEIKLTNTSNSTFFSTLEHTIVLNKKSKLVISASLLVYTPECILGCYPGNGTFYLNIDGTKIESSGSSFSVSNRTNGSAVISNYIVELSAGNHNIKFQANQTGISTSDFYVIPKYSSVLVIPVE